MQNKHAELSGYWPMHNEHNNGHAESIGNMANAMGIPNRWIGDMADV
jgi:hypothetical protein